MLAGAVSGASGSPRERFRQRLRRQVRNAASGLARRMSVSSIRPEDLPSCTSSGSELGGASGEAEASAAAKPEVVDTLREKIFATFDDPSYSKAAKFISIFMMLIILVSTLSFLFEAETLEGGFLRSNKDEAEVRAVSGPALPSCVAPAAPRWCCC